MEIYHFCKQKLFINEVIFNGNDLFLADLVLDCLNHAGDCCSEESKRGINAGNSHPQFLIKNFKPSIVKQEKTFGYSLIGVEFIADNPTPSEIQIEIFKTSFLNFQFLETGFTSLINIFNQGV
jgi:hypothetical protein